MAITHFTPSGSSFLPWLFPPPGLPPLCPCSSKDWPGSPGKMRHCWGVLKQADMVGRHALERAGTSWVGLCTAQVCRLSKIKGPMFSILWQSVTLQVSEQSAHHNAGNTFQFSLILLSHLWLWLNSGFVYSTCFHVPVKQLMRRSCSGEKGWVFLDGGAEEIWWGFSLLENWMPSVYWTWWDFTSISDLSSLWRTSTEKTNYVHLYQTVFRGNTLKGYLCLIVLRDELPGHCVVLEQYGDKWDFCRVRCETPVECSTPPSVLWFLFLSFGVVMLQCWGYPSHFHSGPQELCPACLSLFCKLFQDNCTSQTWILQKKEFFFPLPYCPLPFNVLLQHL